MDNEPAEAMASRLLKAFFDAPRREKAQSALPHATTKQADASPNERGAHIEVPPAS